MENGTFFCTIQTQLFIQLLDTYQYWRENFPPRGFFSSFFQGAAASFGTGRFLSAERRECFFSCAGIRVFLLRKTGSCAFRRHECTSFHTSIDLKPIRADNASQRVFRTSGTGARRGGLKMLMLSAALSRFRAEKGTLCGGLPCVSEGSACKAPESVFLPEGKAPLR